MDRDQQRPSRAGRPRFRESPLGIKAVEQALDVIDALSRAERPQSLTELSAEVAMDPGKLHRYLVSLCARGIVRRIEESGLYDLGPAALSLGVIALAKLDEFQLVRDGARHLSESLREAIFVYVWSQSGPVLVHLHRPTHTMVGLRLGSVVPLVQSATGPIFATYLPPDVIRPIVTRDAIDKGLDPAAVIAGLEKDIAPRVRRDRVLWSDQTIVPDSAACAAPILNMQGDLLCVLGVSFYLHGTRKPPQEPIIEAVRDAAARLSAAIGFVER